MKFLFFFTFASFNSFAKASPNFIVGGNKVNVGDPVQTSTVGIYTPSPGGRKGGALCTGSIIGKGLAVTAAHCIAKSLPSVIFGRDLHEADDHREASGVVVNKSWPTHQGVGMDQGDIAL